MVGDVDDRRERVDAATVHAAGLGADNRRSLALSQFQCKIIGSHPAGGVRVDGDQAVRAEAQKAERAIDGVVVVAAKAVKLAIMAPVTKPTDALSGSPSNSMSHRPVISSTTAAAGASRERPAFWSHVEVSQSAAMLAGVEPPITKPKNRPLWVAISPGSAIRAKVSITSAASSPSFGRPPPRLLSRSVRETLAPTGRIGRPWRKSMAAREAAWSGLSQSGVSTSDPLSVRGNRRV